MLAAWVELGVPSKGSGVPEEGTDEDVMSIIGCGKLLIIITECAANESTICLFHAVRF